VDSLDHVVATAARQCSRFNATVTRRVALETSAWTVKLKGRNLIKLQAQKRIASNG
jgi:hypothetical protein